MLSRKLTTKFLENKDVKVLRDADAIHTEDGWGLICHSSGTTYKVDLSNIFSNEEQDSLDSNEEYD